MTVGNRLGVFARLPCGLPMALWPKVLEVEGGRKPKWLGSLALPGLLDGEYLFMLESLAEAKVRFTQAENYSGVLLDILWDWLVHQGQKAFQMMNRTLTLTGEP